MQDYQLVHADNTIHRGADLMAHDGQKMAFRRRAFLRQAMTLADHVVFLLTINHVWTKARLRDIREADFGLKEILLIDMPKSFPQSGFQLGAVHLQRGWRGKVTLSDLGPKAALLKAPA